MEIIEVKTADLIGPALDWAVAETQGYEPIIDDPLSILYGFLLKNPPEWLPISGLVSYKPSSAWQHFGPLADEYELAMVGGNRQVELRKRAAVTGDGSGHGYGQTNHIAGCRAIVHSKFGDVVSVPAMLVGGES